MRPHGDTENGLKWDDGHVSYHQLSTVLSEAVASFAHPNVYGESIFKLLSQLLGRPVHNLEDVKCPSPRHFRNKYSCTKPCHSNLSLSYATRHAHSLYEFLMYHFQKMYVTCPEDMIRHIADLFQQYKTALIYLHSFRVAMTSRRLPLM